MTSATDSISVSRRPSPRLARALDSERDALERKLRRLAHERERLRNSLAAIETEMQAADERLVLLAQVRGSEDEPRQHREASTDGRTLLTGPAIRMTAVAVVRDRPEVDEALYYRRWLELVEEAGYEVGGQKPAATFLSQIRRSPVIRPTTRPGHYELDRQAPSRLRRRLAAKREELANGNAEQAELVDLQGVRERRGALIREIEKTERDLAEAMAALTLSAGRLASA
jgi:hypothetical protein